MCKAGNPSLSSWELSWLAQWFSTRGQLRQHQSIKGSSGSSTRIQSSRNGGSKNGSKGSSKSSSQGSSSKRSMELLLLARRLSKRWQRENWTSKSSFGTSENVMSSTATYLIKSATPELVIDGPLASKCRPWRVLVP